MEERKREVNAQRRAAAKSQIDRIDEPLPPDLLQAVQQTRDKGASSWLNAIPIEEHGLPLHKQEFRDSLCLHSCCGWSTIVFIILGSDFFISFFFSNA